MIASLPSVLVIDDEPIMGQTLNRMLRRKYRVTVESDARRAVALIDSSGDFDLVICDLMMSPLTGMEVHEHVRRTAPAIADRFLLMTGGAYLPAVEQFLARWPHQVLMKPFGVEEVEQLVVATLARCEHLVPRASGSRS